MIEACQHIDIDRRSLSHCHAMLRTAMIVHGRAWAVTVSIHIDIDELTSLM